MKTKDIAILAVAGLGLYLLTQKKTDSLFEKGGLGGMLGGLPSGSGTGYPEQSYSFSFIEELLALPEKEVTPPIVDSEPEPIPIIEPVSSIYTPVQETSIFSDLMKEVTLLGSYIGLTRAGEYAGTKAAVKGAEYTAKKEYKKSLISAVDKQFNKFMLETGQKGTAETISPAIKKSATSKLLGTETATAAKYIGYKSLSFLNPVASVAIIFDMLVYPSGSPSRSTYTKKEIEEFNKTGKISEETVLEAMGLKKIMNFGPTFAQTSYNMSLTQFSTGQFSSSPTLRTYTGFTPIITTKKSTYHYVPPSQSSSDSTYPIDFSGGGQGRTYIKIGDL